jgi:hypothetical protein
MANETLYSSNITVAAAVEAAIVPVFSATSIMSRLVAPFNPSMPNTNAKKLPKSGSVSASVVAEGNAATPQTLTDTSVTLTLQKAIVVTKPTAEALAFATGANPQRHANEHARACADKFDIDAMALFDGFSTSVDSGATLTVAKLQEAAYNLRLNKVPNDRIVAVLHTKQAYQLGGDIRAQAGAFYGNQNFDPASITDGKPLVAGYFGKVFNIEIYESPNVAAQGGDNVSAVYNPNYAIAALYPSGLVPSFETSISNELGFLESVSHIKTMMWYQIAEYADLAGVELRCDI